MKATPIPTSSRKAVRERDRDRCVRCGGAGSAWHHRRSRSVRDEHTHHPGNGVLLCKTCHDWVHGHPAAAMDDGLILSRHEAEPCTRPWKGITGWWQPECDKQITAITGSDTDRREPR